MTNRFITNTQMVNAITTQYIQMFLNVTLCETVTLYRNITIKLNTLSIVVKHMEDSNSITYIHRTTINLQKTSRSQIYPKILNKKGKTIPSGFIASKLQNQNGSTNLARDIPNSSQQGVTS